MCGIFAVSGSANAANLVLSGLKVLEYRGYDSWGIGVSTKGKVRLEKYTGKIKAKSSKLPQNEVAFGHTRWATHGGVTVPNAHPHLDCTGRIGVVHNGIIENYEELKIDLIKSGHVFVSQTDTEVIAHLVEESLHQVGLLEAVRSIFPKFKGFSALVVFDANTRELVAVRRGSPLVVGISATGIYLASDALSLASHTRKVVFLPDNVLVEIAGTRLKFSDLQGNRVDPEVETLDPHILPAKKDKFPHFMLKEIDDQPLLIASALAAMQTSVAVMAKKIGEHSLVIYGCGSAYFASLFGSYLLSAALGRQVQVVAGNEALFSLPWLSRHNFTLFVSQSGETLDILEAFKLAQEKDVASGALVNVMGSSLSRSVTTLVPLCAGPEIGVASTKVFTSMIVAFYLLAQQCQKTPIHEVKTTLAKAAQGCASLLSSTYYQKHLRSLVSHLRRVQHIFVLGKGRLYPLALEAALKIKEVSYIHAEGFASGELKHGMIALVEKGTPVIVLVPNDETKSDALSAAQEVKARGAFVIGIGPVPHAVFDIHLPTIEAKELTGVPMIVAVQLLAYYLAVAKGNDPDKPRNLAKSVTVK